MTAIVRMRNVTVAYRGHPVLHHLSGDFHCGALSAVIGPNGAGKSTLLSVMAGLQPADQGHLQTPARERMAYLPQRSTLDTQVPVTVQEVVAMGCWRRLGAWGRLDAWHRDAVQSALVRVGLQDMGSRLIGELSAGQVQRMRFARLLVQDAELMLLDEPFVAMDERTSADLLDLLVQWRREGRSVIAVLHEPALVRAHFDDLLVLAREALAWGPVTTVLQEDVWQQARRTSLAWQEGAGRCRS